PAARARTVALLITDALRPPRLPEATAPSAAERELESNPFGPAPSAGPTVARAGPPVHDDALLETGDPYPQDPASSALLIGVGLHARLITRDGNLLLGFELSARGPLLGVTEWAVEGSYSEGDTWTPLQELELNWWNGAVGVDFIAADSPRFSLGPRLAVARVAGETSEAVSFGLDGEQRALVMTLGARANLSARLWRSAAISATLEISHSLYETPLTEQGEYLPWYGWALTWGVGVSFGL
ncbi:MAG TPA: hypothetical protein VJU61_05940, partial [Polyangiaceae bacterium]|nr:hypothetical protein [Polyangiaceae bacterium]